MSEPFKIPLLNEYIANGRLTRDPELRHTAGDLAICKFGLAITTGFKKDETTGKYPAVFLDVKAFGQTAERCAELKKGMPVLVRGSLSRDTWVDKQTGENREKLYVNANSVQRMTWDDNPDGDANAPAGPPTSRMKEYTTSPPPMPSRAPQTRPAAPVTEDDLPF